MTEKYIKNCPICNEIMEYSNKYSLKRSIITNCICKKCSKNKPKISTEERNKKAIYKKECPICKKEISYLNKFTLLYSLREKWICRKCFYKKRTISTKEKEKREYKKKCPICSKIMEYNNKANQKRAEKDNSFCRSCTMRYKRSSLKQKEMTKKRTQKRKNKKAKYKYNNDLYFKISSNIRSSLKISLKSKNISKNRRHWEDLVGYSVLELKEHLEKLFKTGMNWNNRHKWHIDHIIPVSFFQYKDTNDTEFKYCWSLNNLQPLWAEENMKKNDKITLWGKEIEAKNIDRDYFLHQSLSFYVV